jgi:AcrR family transcriptional regulator
MSTADRRSRATMIAETTARLLAVARTAFADQGFAAVSLDALAAQAGMTRGAVHHHFGNKAGLFEAVFRAIDAEIGDELDAVWDTETDPWAAFRACFHAYLDAVVRSDRCRILFEDGPAVLGNRAFEILIDSGLADVIAILDGLIAAGRLTTDEAEALAHALNGATVNLSFWLAADPTRHARAHATLDALFDGLTRD